MIVEQPLASPGSAKKLYKMYSIAHKGGRATVRGHTSLGDLFTASKPVLSLI